MRLNGLFYEAEANEMSGVIQSVIDLRKELISIYKFNPPWSVTRGWEYGKVIYALGKIEKKNKVLDIGSANSIVPFFFRRHSCEAYACDVKKPKRKELQYYKDLGIDYQKAGIVDLPYDDNFFDGICSVCTLEHIYPWKDDTEILRETIFAFQEIARVLKPGGITVHSCDFYIPGFNSFRTYHEELLKKLFKALSHIFEPVDEPNYHIDDPFTYFINNNTQYGKPEERERKHLRFLREGKKPDNLFTCASIALRKL
ncbi:hypothetical protein LCGC14_0667340 [marine sediment metagenome]|uniref:Methyltransferase type 11 domain-containing protein n=1 Tax=marine sediment metagenome TaxID=412755 RepID=A0A0F9QX10_9ZZZZ